MDANKQAALREAFPPSAVGKLPRGNTTLDYVGHAAVTDRLLAVDPEWSWEPFALDEFGLPAMDAAGNLWIKLTICGVTRPGVGDGPTQKVRIGDAIRNAAMRFGVALDLWAKEDLHDSKQAEGSPTQSTQKGPSGNETGELISDAQSKALHAALSRRGITDRDQKLAGITAVIGRPITTTKELTRREAGSVIDSLTTGQGDEPPDDDWGTP